MNKTILILIDGLRSDSLETADTPTLDALKEQGSATMEMKSVSPYLTLPCHFSIFTSLPPYSHGVLTNTAAPDMSALPQTLFYHVKALGGRTSAFYSWEHLRNLSQSGTLDCSVYQKLISEGDVTGLAEAAARYIVSREPDFCFVYLEWADVVGHRSGWMSPDYIKAVEICDRAVGLILEMIRSRLGADSYNIAVMSDHGGIGRHHLSEVPEVMNVPFIACGPGIQKGLDIRDETSITDLAPTLARMLDIPPHFAWEGKAVFSIFETRVDHTVFKKVS